MISPSFASEHNDVILKCDVTASSGVTYKWYKDAQLANVTSSGVLLVQNINRNESSTYTCSVDMYGHTLLSNEYRISVACKFTLTLLLLFVLFSLVIDFNFYRFVKTTHNKHILEFCDGVVAHTKLFSIRPSSPDFQMVSQPTIPFNLSYSNVDRRKN